MEFKIGSIHFFYKDQPTLKNTNLDVSKGWMIDFLKIDGQLLIDLDLYKVNVDIVG